MSTQTTGSLPRWTISSSTAVFAALELEPCGRVQRPRGGFNGKLEAPLLFATALTAPQILALLNERPRGPIASTALAQWDFVTEAHSAQVPDRSAHHRHAHTLNRPLRLVPGRFFSGRTITPAEAPEEFNAAHFHEDDLADAGWELSHTVQIPANFRSGIYALKLRAGDTTDHIPFCVRAPRQGPRAELAVLVPTVSYMVYSNIGMDPAILPPELRPLSNLDHANTAHARYARENSLLSCYDQHADGSGVAIVSLLRPQLMACRPADRSTFNDSPHQLGADLHLIDWLETKGLAYDVLTDHDLHREGAAALLPYRAVLSGTHAEYWTSAMRQGLLDYTAQGGRFVYLSGNGLYWVTALSEDGTLAEVRRPHGTRAWTAEPGAAYISLSGELGGLWMHRGLAPQSAVGVGFSSQGFGPGRPYRRTPASFTPRFSFLFKGIDDELIGDMPALVSGYGAAGYEVDRVDLSLGTPHHATVLASATEFSDCYQYVIENMPAMMPGLGGSTCPEVRADLVYYDTPKNGAVFSTGSIAWCSTLSWNHYDNTVSRLTENVIRAFLAPGPLPSTSVT
jgi:N,N-dimethylformamidase